MDIDEEKNVVFKPKILYSLHESKSSESLVRLVNRDIQNAEEQGYEVREIKTFLGTYQNTLCTSIIYQLSDNNDNHYVRTELGYNNGN